MSEVSRPVEYSQDKWNMERVSWALFFCVAGLAFVLIVDPRPPGPRILAAFTFLATAVALFTVILFLFEQMSAGRSQAMRFVAGGIIIALLVHSAGVFQRL